MDYAQRYTQEKKVEVEDLFVTNVKKFGVPTAIKIAKYLENMIGQVEAQDEVQICAGAMHLKDEYPIFFEVEFLKYLPNSLLLIDIREIDADDYLDYMNAGIYLTHENF